MRLISWRINRSSRHDTYAELILHQVDCVLVQLVQERACLIIREMLEATLQNAAPIGVGRELVNVTAECIDKVEAIRRNTLNHFLDDLRIASARVRNEHDEEDQGEIHTWLPLASLTHFITCWSSS
jgi:hypothetical protein